MTRYTRHKFLPSWKSATSLVLFSTLLGFSSYSFSQNLMTNPGFENGTTGWTLAEDASAQYTESGGRSGYRLTHYSSATTYKAETTQSLSGLSAGTYRFSLYTKGGATSGAWLWAYCDGKSYSTTIPSSDTWVQVVVDNIQLSGNSTCNLGITTQDSDWSSFDDVVFETASTDITVRAYGTDGTENINLVIGGSTVASWTLTTSYQDYTYSGAATGKIQLQFDNDVSGRDVRLDYVSVNGDIRQAEHQSVNTGVWGNSACGGGSRSEWLHCNGYIGFETTDPIFSPPYIMGADWSWVQEHESMGRTYSDGGETKSLERILADHGFNYARFRLFVCPECPGGYLDYLWSGAEPTEHWADEEHVIQMAKRAKACGMGVFLDYHLSDTWASIGEQYRPSEWEGMSLSQMKTASYNHAKNALDMMVAEGVKPDMVQCGNEVNTHVSGYSFNDWEGYSGIINSCIQAVRDTDPNILVVAHHGRPRPDGYFAEWVDKLFVNSNPPIDADVICGSTYGTTNDGQDWWDMFTYATDTTGKPVMSCEYTDKRRDLVNDTFRSLPNSLGTFIWEPTSYGDSTLFDLVDNVYHTNWNIDQYPTIAQEEGLPVPLTPASELEGTTCQ
jgi:arabinogalactan endo-1,4-beta-galactosidase